MLLLAWQDLDQIVTSVAVMDTRYLNEQAKPGLLVSCVAL